jgi:hypothetical protein
MALTQQTLGLGHIGLKKVFTIEMEQLEKQWQTIIGRTDTTNQTYETYKQLGGLAPFALTDEDGSIDFDDMFPLFAQSFRPLMYTKGVKLSMQTSYTDQYGKLKNWQKEFALASNHRRNIVATNLFNLGFTDTTYGMNSETLFSTSHSMGNFAPVGSNRPAVDIALSPLAFEQAWAEVRRQKSARNTPMYPVGKLAPLVPANLYGPARRAINTVRGFGGTVDNDMNTNRDFYGDPILLDYASSQTAWFVRAENMQFHSLFMLNQMPYDFIELAQTDLMKRWAGYESYIAGWYDWHGTWGTVGA